MIAFLYSPYLLYLLVLLFKVMFGLIKCYYASYRTEDGLFGGSRQSYRGPFYLIFPLLKGEKTIRSS